MPKPFFVVLLIALPLITAASTGSMLLTLLMIVIVLVANPVVRVIRKKRYFGSDHFTQLRADLAAVVREHNDLVTYVGEIRSSGSFELGASSTGQHAHLATSSNTSGWNYRRDRNVAVYAPHVHNASLQVVRNAQIEPIKYVMKYFSIKPDQPTLADVQRVANDIARLESAVANVRGREVEILGQINPPPFILKYYAEEFWSQAGVALSTIQVPYPRYTFQYVSAGGNSSQVTEIVLDTLTLEALSATLVERIRWAKSAAGQRAIMTSRLREEIKRRDNYTCLQCRVSVHAEPHLLLEVDHIHPVSRGGLSVPDNLQTLCWRCNRRKGARHVVRSQTPGPAPQQPVLPPASSGPVTTSAAAPSAGVVATAASEGGRPAHFAEPLSPTARPGLDGKATPSPAPMSRPSPGRNPNAPAPDPGQPRFAVLDIETTGLSPDSSRILEIAIVTVTAYGRVLDEWSTKINPQGPVGSTHIHGIRQEDVAAAPVFHDVIAQITHRLAGAAIAAHNARFELSFLQAEYQRAGWDLPEVPHLCTLEASTYYLPQLDRRRLTDCCWAVGTPLVGAHTALGDARATAVLLAAFLHPNWGPAPTTHHLALPTSAHRIVWPSGPVRDPVEDLSTPAPDGFRWSIPTPTAPPLASLLDKLSLADALQDGAPQGSVAYLEMLAEALEDGELSDAESTQLAAAARSIGLSAYHVAATHQAFVQALAHEAASDGHVSRVERAELLDVAARLQLNPKIVPALLDRAEIHREMKLGTDLRPLPADWNLGAPLRVGDRVAVTGCEAFNRQDLETRATAAGVRILGSVSTKTVILVSDGTVAGTKASTAHYLGTRIVHPTEFRTMLQHLQPALPREARALPNARSGRSAAKPATDAAPPPQVTSYLPAGVTPTEVRQWGRDNGWQVGARGRLDQKLVAAFIQNHDGARPMQLKS